MKTIVLYLILLFPLGTFTPGLTFNDKATCEAHVVACSHTLAIRAYEYNECALLVGQFEFVSYLLGEVEEPFVPEFTPNYQGYQSASYASLSYCNLAYSACYNSLQWALEYKKACNAYSEYLFNKSNYVNLIFSIIGKLWE